MIIRPSARYDGFDPTPDPTKPLTGGMVSLKKFEILEMIAKGGMAEVYRAKTVGISGFEKEVCVKKILPHLTEDKSFVEMFVNEAKLAATLNYANIVQVHDLCVSGGGEYFIVMEYVNGKDLSDVIRAAQLAGREVPPEIAVYVCRETCKGLHFAHTKQDADGAPLNIIHRDISPHNVLVSFMGEVKIVDFGIAKASSIMNKTAVGILKGKYGYMSPEQARGQPLDHRSDIFNTGIVLYELLVSERCFAGSSDFSTLNLMRNAEVTPPTKINSNVPKELERIVLQALSLKKENRYPNALAFESALADFAHSSGRLATASDLSAFMQSLFAEVRSEGRAGASTGVLSLSSVVGPPPSPPSPDAGPDEAEPGSEALARAKRRATRPRNGQQLPPPSAANPVAADPRPSEPPAAAPSGPVRPVAPARPIEARVRSEGAAQAKDAPVRERKPARIKPIDGDPAVAKNTSSPPKKPVGRRDLRPGLTQFRRINGGNHTRRLISAAAIVLSFTLIGAFVGGYRGQQISRQASFREMELVDREVAGTHVVNLLIDSVPRGAKVQLDGLDLAGTTPVSVERDRDSEAHRIRLSLKDHRGTFRSVKYGPGPITVVSFKLEGRPGRLELNTKPSKLPVLINGKEAGITPFFKDVPFGRHRIEVGGQQGYAKVERTVSIAAGKRTSLSIEVPKENTYGQLDLRTDTRARIYLDGKATRHWTNDGPIDLKPDHVHKVGLRVQGSRERHEIQVKLRKGEKRALYLDLARSS